MLIMSLGRILGISFERPYTLDNPLVRDFSDVISTFVYRVGLQSHRYNIATAVGLFQSVVGLIFVFASDKFAKLMGEQTGGDGIGSLDPVFLQLPNSGILVQYTMMYGLNPDGSSSEEAGTTPDILSDGSEDPLVTALREIEKASH